MTLSSVVLSAQEDRIERRENDTLTSHEARLKRVRVDRMLKGIRKNPPKNCRAKSIFDDHVFS